MQYFYNKAIDISGYMYIMKAYRAKHKKTKHILGGNKKCYFWKLLTTKTENAGKYLNRRKLGTKDFTMFIILKNMETTGGDSGRNIGMQGRAKKGLDTIPIYCKHFPRGF